MIKFINKFIKRAQNFENIKNNIKILSKDTPIKKIFDAINNFSATSEIRYVGGCIRKIIKNDIVEDIDLATNLNPQDVCEVLKKNEIDYYESGLAYGTITATIDNQKFEITSLREDVETFGRHAKVKFTNDWKKDALRRDFTINSIYSDIEGNLFDPHNGKEDLKNGVVKFIGNPEKRIKEDYLRILRYLRFYLEYSKNKHDLKLKKIIKKNLIGISNLSKERLLDELRKFIKSNILVKLSKDKFSLEIFEFIFPEAKRFKFFPNLNNFAKSKLREADFIFLLSVLIVDGSDNIDYFLYKFKLSKKDHKRLKIIDEFYKEKIILKTFSEENLNRVFYYYGKQSVIDILSYKVFNQRKADQKLLNLIDKFQSKDLPVLPINAKILMEKYNIPEGKYLGDKLKIIEEEWVNNNFQLTENRINEIIRH